MTKDKNTSRLLVGSNLREFSVLALAFGSGIICLLFIKIFLGSGTFSSFLAVIATGISLFGYAAFSYLSNSNKSEPETIGDNCYYLGFLFTLTSLSIVLFQMGGSNEVNNIRPLISGFGVALASTIMGVFLRVVLMQGRNDIVAREREARLSLNQATSELRGALALSIAEIKSFAVEATQLSKETAVSISKIAEEARDIQRSSIAAETERSLRTIEEKLSLVNGVISKQMSDALSGVTQSASNEIRNFASDNAMQSKSALLELKEEVARSNIQLKSFVEDMSVSAKALSSAVQGTVVAVGSLNASTKKSTEGIETDLSATINGLSTQALQIHKALQDIHELSQAISKDRSNWMVRLVSRIKGN